MCKARLTSSADLEQHFSRNHPAEPQSDNVQVLRHELTDVNTTLRVSPAGLSITADGVLALHRTSGGTGEADGVLSSGGAVVQ